MPPRRWKSRLADMKEAVDRIESYCEGISSLEEFQSNHKTFDACVRNLQVIGESSHKIPVDIQAIIPEIPWSEIRGMRNVLVHQYFGISPSMVWSTIKNNLPELKRELKKANEHFNTPAHEWKICPPGEVYVRSAQVKEHIRKGEVVREHLRRDHCRDTAGHKSILTPQEIKDIDDMEFDNADLPCPDDLDFKGKGSKFDRQIGGWTKYWNDALGLEPPISANLIKALMGSESGFDAFSGKKAGKGAAKGLMQLMPKTMRYLNGERKELKDHVFMFQGDEVFDPGTNISAGIRWLIRKRETASARLGRQATWDEAVEEYKDYLRRRPKKNEEHPKMNQFRSLLERLRKCKATK